MAPDGDYRPFTLGEDVVALMQHFGAGDQITLVGYDWGAAAAYAASILAPELVAKLVVLDVPHPGVQKFDLSFAYRNRHILLFQMAGLGGWRLRRNDFAYLGIDHPQSAVVRGEDNQRVVGQIEFL